MNKKEKINKMTYKSRFGFLAQNSKMCAINNFRKEPKNLLFSSSTHSKPFFI